MSDRNISPGPGPKLVSPLLSCLNTSDGESGTNANSTSIQRVSNPSHINSVIQLGHKAFAIQGRCEYEVRLTESLHLDTLTCFVFPKTTNLKDQLENAYLSYQQNDDVFCDAFLTNVLLVSDETTVDEPATDLLASWGCLKVFQLSNTEKVPPGPYFFSACGLYPAWRIFPDDKDAFILSKIPTQNDPYTYENLNAAAYGASSLCIAVPSRLKTSRSEWKPLAGMRIAIKDLFHLKGVHTGCGNRAYRRLHGILDTSSSAAESVLDLGGIIVGKTKTVEFGSSQEVIGDCWRKHTRSSGCPRNSLRVYSLFPVVNTIARLMSASIFHTTGFIGRSSSTMLEFGRHWLRIPSNDQHLKPTRVLFPKEYHSDHEGVQKIAEEWVSSLATWLEADRLDISIEETWHATKPESAGKGFFDTFNKTFIDVIYSEFWSYLSDFRESYKAKFNADPYVCKVTQYLWKEGTAMSEARKSETLNEVLMHNDWCLGHLLMDDQTIIIVPRYKIDYRDEYLPAPEFRSFEGFDSNFHASLSGVPNLIIPVAVGQCPFHSQVSGKEEYFPVSLSIFAPKGKLHMLFITCGAFVVD
ncbi:amidase-like protein [Xylaria flabelliformis]|nr:amidase-like protein [Xylaria flabelliformis]